MSYVKFFLPERNVPHLKIYDISQLYKVYEFREELGHGNFGVVICALEKKTMKTWAIKIINKLVAGAKLVSVNREIMILKCIDHPNIIYLERIYETSKKIYLVFERCNAALYEVYKGKKPFTEAIAKNIIKQLAAAIAYLHKKGIVHRDVKLENILIADNPNDASDEYYIKLTDFGLSIVKTGIGVENMLHDYCGTVLYMAPEILTKESYSELCDVWSLGVIVYMLLYGCCPFFVSNDVEVTKTKICTQEPLLDTENISEEANDLILLTLKKNPIQRITAAQVLNHPWIADKKLSSVKDENILNFMRKWRTEKSPAEEQPDWLQSVLYGKTPIENKK